MVAGPLRRRHEASPGLRLRRWLAAHEPRLVALWVGGWLAVFAFLALWGLGLGGLERMVDHWNARWELQLARGEELHAAGQFEQAVEHLERLEARHPAVFVKHGLDRQRERVLELLGQSHAALGNRRRALETLERLVALDPRNFHSHFVRARVAARLDEPELARAEYAAALAIHPSYLPALEGLVELEVEAGLDAAVVAAFERYLDAWLLAAVTLRCGERTVTFELPVDGRPHVVEVPLSLPAGWSGEACLETGGYSFRVLTLALAPPLLAGDPRAPAPTAVWDAAVWTLAGAETTPQGAFSAHDAGARACRADLALELGAARARVELSLHKALPPRLWDAVERSYRNTLRYEDLEAARARSVVGGCLEAGSLFVD